MKFPIRKAVMAVIVDDDFRILIGSSPRDGGYKFPQGGLEPNEDTTISISFNPNYELGSRVSGVKVLSNALNVKVVIIYPYMSIK